MAHLIIEICKRRLWMIITISTMFQILFKNLKVSESSGLQFTLSKNNKSKDTYYLKSQLGVL